MYEEKQAGQCITEADAILICLSAGKITYGALEHTLENIAVYEEKVLGAILLQEEEINETDILKIVID